MNSKLKGEVQDVLDSYSSLKLVEDDSEHALLGSVYFSASVDGKETIEASYDIKISIPHSYPVELPKVYSSGYQLDERFEHTNPDTSFCLAVPFEERKLYDYEPTLLGFINNLVVPFLYGYSYFLKHGKHPFGEREHGDKGILNFYLELFGSSNAETLILSLCKFAVAGYQPHEKCPCGSGKKVLKCHKTQLKELLINESLLKADLLKFIKR